MDAELMRVIDSTKAAMQELVNRNTKRTTKKVVIQNGKMLYGYKVDLNTGDTTWIKKPKQ